MVATRDFLRMLTPPRCRLQRLATSSSRPRLGRQVRLHNQCPTRAAPNVFRYTTESSIVQPKQQQRFFRASIGRLTTSDSAQEEGTASTAQDDNTNTDNPKQYSTPELTRDAAQHKAGLDNPDRPDWQNPLIHDQPPPPTYREDFDSEEEFQDAVLPAPPLQTDENDDKPPTPDYLEDLADEILELSVLEFNELLNKMADHYGFHPGMLSPDEQQAEQGDQDDDAETEAAPAKTAFDIKLTGFDASAKIKVIKEVRAIAGLGLKEAKEMVEGAPKVIQKDLKPEQAEEIKAKLEQVGATVEIV